MPDERCHILLAEDDPNLGTLLAHYLQSEGLRVTLCRDGQAALEAFQQQAFDLCLLDVMMPELDGFSVAGRIRAENPDIPLLFITARSLREDKLKGYRVGADDYIIKPFDEEELLWKIKALLRRHSSRNAAPEGDTIRIGIYTLQKQQQSLAFNGQARRLTEMECRILEYLHLHRNRIVRREDLLKTIWGQNDYFLGRSLDVFITKIRKYLKEDPSLQVENVYGVGFIFHTPEAS